MIFGTFSDEVEDVETYLGPDMAEFIKRNLGRPLRVLGTHSQTIHNNWKLYAENLRDSYHATLLHTFYTTFKVNRLDMDGGITCPSESGTILAYARRAKMEEAAEYAEAKVHSANYDSALEGPGLLEAWEEFDDGITHSIQTVFPNMCIQFTLNSLAIRFFAPRGVDQTELFWIYLGYERDTEEQSQMRVMQSNLTGAAGLVSLEDGCINEFVQRGTRADPDRASFMEMGGRQVESEKEISCDRNRGPRFLAWLSRHHGILRQDDDAQRSRKPITQSAAADPRSGSGPDCRLCSCTGRRGDRSLAAVLHCQWPVSRHNQRKPRAGLPIGIMRCVGRGMMVDRVKAFHTANIFEPHTYNHMIGHPVFLVSQAPGA